MSQIEMDFDQIPGVVRFPATRSKQSAKKQAVLSHCAEIKVFPFQRRSSMIQNIALGLETRKGRRRTEFWLQTIEALTERMRAIQQTDAVIHNQLRHFKSAVQSEIDRMRFGDEPHGNRGGAA
ncbi:DUF6074 family protein [Mesorhizobium sp. M0700]|uniref:DUF6074 family protein n=1 Tax=Mesorhizobium sp. M0700 TaxID=2956988 RepID=UPI00333CBA6B